jgi:hypothetical protein
MARLKSARPVSGALLILGAACFGLGAISFVLSRNFFDPVAFGRRAAQSLSDPGVAAYAGDSIATAVIRAKPDLIAFRPLLTSAGESLVTTTGFRFVVERAATRAHQAAFSQGSERLLLSLPDLNVLVHDAVSHASPALAAKIPKNLDAIVTRMASSRTAANILLVARAGRWLRNAWPPLFVLALSLFVLGLWLAPRRQQAMARSGVGLVVVGLVLVGLVAINPLASLWIHDDKLLGLVRGLWRTFLGDLARWGILFTGLGVLITSGASSVLERVSPLEQLSRWGVALASPRASRWHRFSRGLGLFLCGCLVFSYPSLMLSAAAVIAGIGIAYTGSRELFRLFLDTLDKTAAHAQPEERQWRGAAVAFVALLVAALGAGWFILRNPVQASTPPPAILACNGFPELCDRPVDQVVFAGAHNAMSNQDAPGWMFPHHEAGMPQMLQDGIRALLIDVHYGFPGGSRVKTDMGMEPTADKIKQAVGDEGYAAAMRIRDRLVGVDESKHQLYFCHGFCELGAYPVAPALGEIRDFVATHPAEVLILVVEDAVTPQDLAAEFDKAGFADLVYTGNPAPPWPTLRQLIESGRRVLLFIESGRPGVPWLHPAFETFRETPYTFHKVEDFSCRANRGGDAGSLFQINHWIDTTPTPKPSNAAIVNAHQFLLDRARKCASERRHKVNLVAVDFYRTGDLLAVVNELNGVGEPGEAASNP